MFVYGYPNKSYFNKCITIMNPSLLGKVRDAENHLHKYSLVCYNWKVLHNRHINWGSLKACIGYSIQKKISLLCKTWFAEKI